MIFVSVGTTKYPFTRLVRTVDEIAPRLDEDVFIQTGYTATEYTPTNAEYAEYVSRSEYDRLVAECDRFVSHAGTGSIITAIKAETPTVLVPRSAARGEHINDHQAETARGWQARRGLDVVTEIDELRRKLREADPPAPTYERNTTELHDALGDVLDGAGDDVTVFCPSPPGGRLTQLLELRETLGEHDTRYLTWEADITGSVDGVELIDGYHINEFPSIETARNFVVSKAQIGRLIATHRPDVVVSLGGGDLVLYTAYLAKLLGATVVHIESMTRFTSASTTGRYLYPVADHFFVQHADVVSAYGEKAEYHGALF
jgi:UDP-N-acetylglucosamine transferase subunit ALG13